MTTEELEATDTQLQQQVDLQGCRGHSDARQLVRARPKLVRAFRARKDSAQAFSQLRLGNSRMAGNRLHATFVSATLTGGAA